MITLAGAITAVIIAATVEIVGGLVTGAGPSAMTHVIAAMLAIPIGYAVAMTLAVGELARGMDSIFIRIVSEAQLVRAHALQAADAQTITKQQRQQRSQQCPLYPGHAVGHVARCRTQADHNARALLQPASLQ